MSRQRDALVRILPGLCEKYPGCGILLFGSVGRGEEHPRSDLDIMVIYDGTGDLEWLPGAPISEPDLNVDLAVFPAATLQRISETRWFVFWELSQAAVAHDPTGIAGRIQASLRRRFNEHPEVTRVWQELMAAVSRSKKQAKVDLPFGGRPGIEKYLERLLSGSTGTGAGAGGNVGSP